VTPARWRWLLAVLLAAACRRQVAARPADATPKATPEARHGAADAGTRTHVPTPGADIPKVDIHMHIDPAGMAHAIALMNAWGIAHGVNLSGGSPGRGLEVQLAVARQTGGRMSVFCNLDWRLARAPGYGARMAAQLDIAKRLGAIGLKVPKGLGLGYLGPDGKLIRVDEPGLDPVWERAARLGLPVAIHIGDPKAFWLRPDERNERIDELRVHPEWSNYGQPVPSWQQLFDAFERLVARHPRTTFIGVHFGNDPEDPTRVARLLDKHANLLIDTAARVPEIGRQPADKMQALFTKYQDRVLFGTDLGVGEEASDLMLGSTGATPPDQADTQRFFESTFRYFETTDRQFEHPTPIQGRWRIDGVGLPRPVLEKIYWRNAARVLGLSVPGTSLPSDRTR